MCTHTCGLHSVCSVFWSGSHRGCSGGRVGPAQALGSWEVEAVSCKLGVWGTETAEASQAGGGARGPGPLWLPGPA